MTKLRSMTLIAGAIVVALLAGAWFLALSPQKSKVSSLKTQTASALNSNASLSNKLVLLKKQEKQIPSEQAKIAEIAAKIPSTPALTTYVRTLTALATANHVELVSISPAAPVAVHVSAGAGGSSAAPAAGAALSSIGLQVNVVGDYYNVQQFIGKIEDTQRVSLVSSISMEPGALPQPQGQTGASGNNGQSDYHTLAAQLSIAVFMSGVPSTGGAAAGATTAPAAAAGTPAASPTASSN